MTQTKAELLAALAENALQIKPLVASLDGSSTWQETFDQIVALRIVQKDLETNLKALRNSRP